MSLTRRALLRQATERLEAAGIEHARRQAQWLMESALGVGRTALVTDPEAPVTPAAAERFEALVVRRLAREPVQYVLGHTDFFGLRLDVTPDVLIPRPETEQLVERALEALKGTPRPWVLDVGTGSGAIALAVKHTRPDAVVFACDVSQPALDVATANAARHGLDVAFVHADALAPAFADDAARAFDLLASNPPYVPDAERDALQPEVREWEPPLALFTGDDPLRPYRALVGHALRLLKPGGRLLVETHADYGADVLRLVREADFAEARLFQDLSGHDRIVEAVYAAEGVPTP